MNPSNHITFDDIKDCLVEVCLVSFAQCFVIHDKLRYYSHFKVSLNQVDKLKCKYSKSFNKRI